MDIETGVRAAIEAGDASGAAALVVESYGSEILSFLAGVLRDETAANDVYSQFCEDVLRGLSGFAWKSSLRTWLYTLARNARHRHFRDPYRRRKRRLDSVALPPAVERARSQTRPYLKTTIKDRFEALRAGLSADERALLILRVDRRLSWAEIAEVLSDDQPGFTPAALRQRFKRLKDKLRRMAREAGLLD